MSTQPTLPTELIFRILCHSDPRDIPRWRTVSKAFYAITSETTFWKALYENVSFPRPPGPLLTQRALSLERTLLKAARLTESWTTQPMRALSSITINHGPNYVLKLSHGRWIVALEPPQRLVLHDIDPVAGKHTQQVIWEEMADVKNWDVASIISEGHCMVYVSLGLANRSDWRLLEFCLDYETGRLTHSTAIDPPRGKSSKVELDGVNSKCLFIKAGADKFVFDTQTHVFHEVPPLLKLSSQYSRQDVLFSDTGLISLCHFNFTTTVYIFTILPDCAEGESGQRSLRLTHEGVIGPWLDDVEVMKSTVDPHTGAMNVRLLTFDTGNRPLQLLCAEMILPKYSGDVVLPINIKMHDIKLPRERVRLGRYGMHCKYIDVSDDKYIRGFFMAKERVRNARPWDMPANQVVMKFTINTTQDPWVVTCNKISPAVWDHKEDPDLEVTNGRFSFDGMRGRLCYVNPEVPGELIVAEIE